MEELDFVAFDEKLEELRNYVEVGKLGPGNIVPQYIAVTVPDLDWLVSQVETIPQLHVERDIQNKYTTQLEFELRKYKRMVEGKPEKGV